MRKLAFLLSLSLPTFANAESPTTERITTILNSQRYEELKPFGADALNPLLSMYEGGDIRTRTQVASALYYLSLKSERARDLLYKDLHTPDENLRLQVQWALGRVSSDESVVKGLLDNMRNDPNPLFRDKAACALASDQIHLTEPQRLLMLEGVVEALGDEKDDVRRIALQILTIQTGQSKGFSPDAAPTERDAGLGRWRAWIAEYRAHAGAQ
ncbi:MAG: HEAT repeat domain-containing protein [Deltaproteobacteria bacterium]|nr:HEAT repeat domain-containing protein [Deltaproteobacteria bacterium]